MKLLNTLLPLAAVSSAFVIPDEELTNQIVIQSEKDSQTFLDRLQGNAEEVWSGVEETFKSAVAISENALDNAINAASNAASNAAESFECHVSMSKFDTQGWLDSAQQLSSMADVDIFEGTKDHPHKSHKPHHPHKPHHGHRPHHKPNQTVYELIASSKYTTKLAKLINEYPDLVEILNGTAANYTVFAPTDKAFEKLPKHHKPSKELIKKVLAYHVSPDFYPAGRVLVTHTIPTALGEDSLGGEPQRLRVGLSLGKGLNVNFYSRIVAVDIFGTNGVIHGVDSLLLPPPPALKIVELFPSEFSTFQLGLVKTGLFDAIAKSHHEGGTLFVPNNWAFKKLGPKINAFLFSKYGEKYLKGLLEYHVVANKTLYSDAFYQQKDAELKVQDDMNVEDIPKGHFHVDLPTLLAEKSLSIDVARYGGFITIKINGFSSVSVQDGIAKDGVLHVLSSILIPPKTPGGAHYDGEDMSVEEFMERFEPYVKDL
ncbi:Aurofusarin biosynthesis cluster protein S [Lachnellula suecica]|uniref:Aurofusarin biosynthesis cluster protein S n=1 Tax=Lachnellula suecica TaxID=602035 RepID=A0A8T9BY29_9HELO|nr:Aurofusarin biosynthesis cluster protein S [Lachnellula suecica]